MQRTEKRMLCDCISRGDLIFMIDGEQETGLGVVEFAIRQEAETKGAKNDTTGTQGSCRIEGVFYPKDAKTSTELLDRLDNAEIRTISGVFEDRNTGRQGEVTLEHIVFPSVMIGWSSWTFTADSGKCPGS